MAARFRHALLPELPAQAARLYPESRAEAQAARFYPQSRAEAQAARAARVCKRSRQRPPASAPRSRAPAALTPGRGRRYNGGKPAVSRQPARLPARAGQGLARRATA
ncbi:hypothetical protein JCM13210_20720 [Thermaerobacter litoralis]